MATTNATPVARIALVCASNQNRSVEAHALLARRGYHVRSFGTGLHCKLPGPAADKPNIFEFNTPYMEMHRVLTGQNQALYTENGVLSMLERNARVKLCPERWQLCADQFKIVITFEQRVFDTIVEDIDARSSSTTGGHGEHVHVFNVPIKDTHEEATIGAAVALQLIQMLEQRGADWESELDTFREHCERERESPRPPICNLASTPTLLVEFGKRWVMAVESRRVFTMRANTKWCGNYARNVHLWAFVSPTLGIVDCGAFQCPPPARSCLITAAFGGNSNTFLVMDMTAGAVVTDRTGKILRTLSPNHIVTFIGMNSRWLVLLVMGDGYCRVHLWKLVDRCLTQDERDEVSVELHKSTVGQVNGNLSPFDKDKAALVLKTFYRQNCTASKEDQPVVFLVDLEKTFRTQNLVIDEALSVPHQACGSMWVNATLYVDCYNIRGSHRYLFNTKTKEVIDTTTGTFLGNIGPHHLCQVDWKNAVLNVFPSSDLSKPCRVHHLPIPISPGIVQPLDCGIVPVVSTPDSSMIDMCDAVTGMVLAECWF
ncbi:RNA polymerase II subunit A C-terminal domain phosphatase SSU72 [Pelomyxa schiedti]|nr:RNA polymerase II subunit A C-terminal domain phosphatase SSU72 [Pelomyxa schiedti]